VLINGYNLTVGGGPIFLRGVCWSPFAVGTSPNLGHSRQYATHVTQDAPLMRAAGLNAVRTYGPIMDTSVLDALWSHGIYVIMTVYYDSGYGATAAGAVATVCALKSHPAILMWNVLNEPNYLYSGSDYTADGNAAAAAIKAADPSRPVAIAWGELPTTTVLSAFSNVDVWGLNVYRGGSGFGTLFSDYAARSQKPMFLTEYGADSYSAALGREDQETHATEVGALTRAVAASAATTGGVSVGGMLFEWAECARCRTEPHVRCCCCADASRVVRCCASASGGSGRRAA
jgi:hypothetical protein